MGCSAKEEEKRNLDPSEIHFLWESQQLGQLQTRSYLDI
jgi:hypothetical protein